MSEVVFVLGPAEPLTDTLATRSTVYLCTQGMFDEQDFGEAPVPDTMPGVKGIFLGGCVDTRRPGVISKNCSAAAHAHISGTNDGWICFQLPSYFYEPEYHWLRMHELAHIMSRQGHTDKWRAALMGLGEEIPARYRRRNRKPKK